MELSTWKQLIYAILLYVGFNKIKIDLDIQISMDGSRGNDRRKHKYIRAYMHQEE